LIDSELSVLGASPATPRRRWSSEAKPRILAETLEPAVNVSAVARRHGLKPQQLFGWRRQALRSGMIRPRMAEADGPAFIAIEAAKPDAAIKPDAAMHRHENTETIPETRIISAHYGPQSR
jgi:transposase